MEIRSPRSGDPPAVMLCRESAGGTAEIITSSVSRAWPIPDAGLSTGLGVLLMFSRLAFGMDDGAAHSDHVTGSLVVTVSVIALSEVARPLRYLNALFGLWLLAAPWLMDGATQPGAVADMVIGAALIALSVPRGRRSAEHYGSWDRFVF